jgi:hypothetical protein
MIVAAAAGQRQRAPVRYAGAMTADATQPPFTIFGDPDADLVAGGHSHTACLIIAMNEGRVDPVAEHCAVAFTSDWHPPTTDAYWDYLVGQGAGRTVAIVWSGNEHNGMYLLQQKPSFRVFDSEAVTPELGDEYGDWIPRTEFRELWSPSFDGLRAVLARLTPLARVLVMCTPPPKSDGQVRAALATEPFFLEQAAQLGYDATDLQITPEPTRVALWRVLRDLLQEVAEAGGATFVPLPPGTYDDHGLLLPEYDGGDVTHANGAYGGLVWAQLLRYYALQGAR